MRLAASSGFHRRPRSRAVAWILPELRRRFHRWRANGFPDALSHVHRAHPVPVASAASKRHSPHEAVASDGRVSPRAAARALLGFRPSRAFLRSSLGSSSTRRTIPSTAELAPLRQGGLLPAAG